MEEMAGGESGDLNLATNSEYNNELSKEAEELKKKREIGEYNLWRPMSTYNMISQQMQYFAIPIFRKERKTKKRT